MADDGVPRNKKDLFTVSSAGSNGLTMTESTSSETPPQQIIRIESKISNASGNQELNNSNSVQVPWGVEKRKKAPVQQVPTEALAKINTSGLKAYIPRVLLESIDDAEVTLQQRTLDVAALFVDICGFTRITEELKRSVDGSNGMAEHLNNFFALLLDVIEEYGGDVVQFSGDAVLAIWPCRSTDDLSEQTERALSCGAQLVKATADETIQFTPTEKPIRLGVHTALGAGEVRFATVGGVGGSYRYMTVGPAVRQAVVIADCAAMDQIVVSKPAKDLLDSKVQFSEAAPNAFLYVPRPDDLTTLSSSPHLPESEVSKTPDETLRMRIYNFLFDTIITTWGRRGELRTISTLFLRLGVDTDADSFEAIQQAVKIIQYELAIRDGILNKVLYDDKGVTLLCLFGLPGHVHEDDTARAVAFAWACCERLETICSIAIGISRSKAYCGYCGSGHRREYTVIGDGVNMAARVMQHSSSELNQKSPSGVEPSVLFVDEPTKIAALAFRYGPPHETKLKGKAASHRIYEVVDTVMHGRISNAGSSSSGRTIKSNRAKGGISSPSFADTVTSRSTGRRTVKTRRLDTGDSVAELDELDALAADQREIAVEIFGRDVQISQILEMITFIQRASQQELSLEDSHPSSRTLEVVGEAAIGKSILLHKIASDASIRGVKVFTAQGQPLENYTPYACISNLMTCFAQKPLLWLAADIDEADIELRPLLNMIIPALNLKETNTTKELSDGNRLDAAQDIVLGFYRRAYQDTPVLLCIDDSHFIDKESMTIITHVTRNHPCVGTLVAHRPEELITKSKATPEQESLNIMNDGRTARLSTIDEGVWDGFDRGTSTKRITLGSIDLAATAALFRKILHSQVDEQVVRVLRKKCGGNPGIGEQILVSLLDQVDSPLLISEEGRIAKFAPGVDVNKLDIPDGIEGIITGRVDRLQPVQQHYLKVASVIGSSFTIDLLSRTLGEDFTSVAAVFSQLESLGFVQLIDNERYNRRARARKIARNSPTNKDASVGNDDSSDGNPGQVLYMFKLHIMADVLYEMLLTRERREFHLIVANELESDAQFGSSSDLTALIRHFSGANANHRSLHYLGKAADASLARGRALEASKYIEHALSISNNLSESEMSHQVPPDVKLHWNATLSQTHYQMGNLAMAKQCALQVLNETKLPIPLSADTGCGVPLSVKVKWHRTVASVSRPIAASDLSKMTPEETSKARDRVLAIHVLTMIAYHNKDQTLMSYYALIGFKIAKTLDVADKSLGLRGKRGSLHILSMVSQVTSYMSQQTILSMIQHAKETTPSDKLVIQRLSTLLFLNAGLSRTMESQLKDPSRDDLDLATLQLVHLSAGCYRAISGRPEDGNKRLLSCARMAHNSQDPRSEAYALTLSAFVDAALCGGSGGFQQAASKIHRVVQFRDSKDSDHIFDDKRLNSLLYAVSALVALKRGNLPQAIRDAEVAADKCKFLDKTAASIITVQTLFCLLEVQLHPSVLEAQRGDGGSSFSKNSLQQINKTLSSLKICGERVTCALPLYNLWKGIYEYSVSRNRSTAQVLLESCISESNLLHLTYFAARASHFMLKYLPEFSRKGRSLSTVRDMYLKAGTSEKMQHAGD